ASQSRRQGSTHDQLALQTRRELVAFRQAWRQMLAMSHIPLAQFAVMLAIIVAVFAVFTPFFFGFAAIMLVLVVPVTVAVALCQRRIRAEGHCNCGGDVNQFVGKHVFSSGT